MSIPDYLHGFGASNRTPGSSREEKTFHSSRNVTVNRHGLHRSEVIITKVRGGRWNVSDRRSGRLIAKLKHFSDRGYMYERPSSEGPKPSAWYPLRRDAIQALLDRL